MSHLFFTVDATDCMHPRWCRAKRDGEHSAECPTRLRMSDGDVDAFCAKHVRLDVNAIGVRILRGELDGLRASTTLTFDVPFSKDVTHHGDVMRVRDGDELRSRRWLAEELVKHQQIGTKP